MPKNNTDRVSLKVEGCDHDGDEDRETFDDAGKEVLVRRWRLSEPALDNEWFNGEIAFATDSEDDTADESSSVIRIKNAKKESSLAKNEYYLEDYQVLSLL